MSDEKWLAVSIVAKKLNVSARTVYRLIESKRIVSRKVGVGGCTQVSEKSVISFINDCTVAE